LPAAAKSTLGNTSVGVGYGMLSHSRHCVEAYATKVGNEIKTGMPVSNLL